MKEEKKIFWYAILTFVLSLVLLTIGVLFYFYQSYILKQPMREALKNFAINLALWESIVAISGIFLFHRLFNVYLKHKRETQEIFKGLFQAVSHRFGNFLATEKVILALLESTPTPEIIQRLKKNLAAMEKDFFQLVSVLKNLEQEPLAREPIRLHELIHNLSKELQVSGAPHRDVTWKHRGKATLEREPLLVRTILLLLLDNAFRYAHSYIHVRCGRVRRQTYCCIANDVSSSISPGTGLGLKLARHFAEKTSGKIKTKEETGKFSVLVTWRQ